MEAHLCSLCSSVVLYPQAKQRQDHEGRLVGYVELNCKTDCNVDTMRLRLSGMSRSLINASTILEETTARHHWGSAHTFLIREAAFFDVHTRQELVGSETRQFAKGKHTISYEITVPGDMPASQDSTFEKVNYELTLFIQGRPSKNILRRSFSHNPVQPVSIEVHPSPEGTRGLNRIHSIFRRSTGESHAEGLRASICSNNARMGGCFNLIIQHPLTDEQETIDISDLSLTLEQYWNVGGERAKKATLSSIVADMDSLKRDSIETEQMTQASRDSQDEDVKPSPSLDEVEPLSPAVPTEPPRYEQVMEPSEEHTNNFHEQRIKFHSYFPNSSESTEKGSKGEQYLGWQASTPEKTKDDVRIEHLLTLVVKYTTKNDPKTVKEVIATTPITLVTETFRTEALQLPKYTTQTVIEPEPILTPVLTRADDPLAMSSLNQHPANP